MNWQSIGREGDRTEYIRRLNDRLENLVRERVVELKDTVWQSYQTSTLVPQIAQKAEVPSSQLAHRHDFKSIGVRRTIELNKFNASDYYWTPYFSDVGRAVATGERKYFHQRISRQIKGSGDTISRSSPDFRVLNERIAWLSNSGLNPDTIIAPVELMVNFIQYYNQQLEWINGAQEMIMVGDRRLRIYWSNKRIPLRSFIIFNSNAGTWYVVPDPETGRAITIGLGQSSQREDKVEYWVETIVRYEITTKDEFNRINLSK